MTKTGVQLLSMKGKVSEDELPIVANDSCSMPPVLQMTMEPEQKTPDVHIPMGDNKETQEAWSWTWCGMMTSVLSIFFCSLTGLFATIFSVLSYVDYKVKDYKSARRNSRCATGFAVTGIVIGIVIVFTIMVMVAVNYYEAKRDIDRIHSAVRNLMDDVADQEARFMTSGIDDDDDDDDDDNMDNDNMRVRRRRLHRARRDNDEDYNDDDTYDDDYENEDEEYEDEDYEYEEEYDDDNEYEDGEDDDEEYDEYEDEEYEDVEEKKEVKPISKKPMKKPMKKAKKSASRVRG